MRPDDTAQGPAAGRLRLDVWLDVTCLFKTRSEAQRACKGGKVEVNGLGAKSHRELKVGDTITISRPLGRQQVVVVKGLSAFHVAKAEARLLYDDVTPQPTADERAFQDLLRMTRVRPSSPNAPNRRDQRALRRLKHGGSDEPS